MNLKDSILNALAKKTAQNPMRGDDLIEKLGVEPDTLNDALDDLQGRGALNRAEITRDGKTHTALWPTGITPRNTSWKEDRDNGKGFSSLVAHNAQQDAECSRQAMISPEPQRGESPAAAPHPVLPKSTPEEPAMVRVTRPAQIVEKVEAAPAASHRPHNLTRNTGVVQNALLDVLRDGETLDVETIFSRCKADTTLGSVGKTLEHLAARGLLEASIRFHNKRNRRFYRLICALQLEPTEAAKTAAKTDPEHAGTIAKLRQLGADDHSTDAGETVDPASAAAQALDLDTPERMRFAFWDDGQLLITQGDEMMVLDQRNTRRMAEFLYGCAGAVYAGTSA